MKRLFLLLLVLLMPVLPALAEAPETGLTIELMSTFHETPPRYIADEGFIRWLEPLLAADDPCTTPVELMPAHHQFLLTFTAPDGTQTQYGLWHDTLYEQATITHPDGTMHRITPDVPALLYAAVYDTVRFSVREEHRALLAENGWTVAYRVPMLITRLPEKLEASRTDASALYFTYANLFLEAGGYDITPHLGQPVIPYVYRLYERVNRIAWCPDDIHLLDENGEGGVMYGMQAVVLECGGEIIGAYLRADSWDTADMMTLDRRSSVDLLGDMSNGEYLLARLPMTEEEQALAALTPEEVVRRYASLRDPRLMAIDVTLSKVGAGCEGILFSPLAALPTGLTALTVEQVEREPQFYEVWGDGWCYYPEVVLESPETGWKLIHFHNTGL